MPLRERRLTTDAAMIQKLFGEGSRIRLLHAEGDPPEHYRMEYAVRGLAVQGDSVVPIDRHEVEVFLTLAYPRQAPQCRMLTPVFHPNIAPHAICIGDHWSAGESLPRLLVRIAEMLCFQSYNVKSPLNGDAARWVETHVAELPLDHYDFHRLLASAEEATTTAVSSFSSASLPPREAAPVPEHSAETPGPRSQPAERQVVCASCGAALSIPADRTDPWARCPLCGRVFPLR